MDALGCLECFHPHTFHPMFNFYAVTDVHAICIDMVFEAREKRN